MNIFDFETSVNSKILDRGYNYYLSEYVNDNFEKNKNTYTFSVDGNDTYEIIVELDKDNNILNSECDCPYDYGPICKHEVAVFYKLREIFEEQEEGLKHSEKNIQQTDIKQNLDYKKQTQTEEKTLSQTTLPQVLQNLEKNQLIKIIIEEVNQNSNLKDSILIRYSPILDNKKEIARWKDHIYSKFKVYLKSNQEKYYSNSYNEYYNTGSNTREFTEELNKILSRAEQYSDKILGIEISFIILAQTLYYIESKKMFYEECDYDDTCYIDQLIDDILDTMERIATSEKAPDIRRKIFDNLLKKCESIDLEGWYTHQMDIIKICCEISDNLAEKELIRLKIEAMIDMQPENWNSMYDDETLMIYLYEFLEGYLEESELDKFIDDNIEYSTFRELAIKKCFEKGKFEKVVEHTKQAEKYQQNLIYIHGDKLIWKKYRYDAYKNMGLIEEQKNLAKELLFLGEFSYYEELKSISKDKNFYKNFNKDMQDLKSTNMRMYIRIIEEENDLDSIMQFVRENKWIIEKYAQRLLAKYQNEVEKIYREYLEKHAEYTSNRKQYQELCGKIRKYKNIIGKNKANELIEEFKVTYKRRRAMIEELSKIK